MSTIYTVDWMQFLNPDSELPTDVTFSVVQSSGTYKGDFVCSVQCQKILLGMSKGVNKEMNIVIYVTNLPETNFHLLVLNFNRNKWF